MDGGRVRYLDGLRGVAALIVLITHISITLVSQFITVHGDDSPLTKAVVPFGKLPIGFLWNGNSAVCVFFILSGFVMADFGFRSNLGLTAQVARRYVRLALPILLTSTFAYLFMKFGLFRNVEAGQVIDSGWLATWYNFAYSGRSMIYESLFETFLNGTYLYNANLWTMQSELIGSIAILSIVSLSRDRKERVALLPALCCCQHLNLSSSFCRWLAVARIQGQRSLRSSQEHCAGSSFCRWLLFLLDASSFDR
jgi:peptidoglycan/LPS O-acetylase OafA/YrhL